MNILVLSSLEQHDSIVSIRDIIQGELSEQEHIIDWINLVEKDIEYCNGCGYCGYKRPGVCVKNDDMIDIFYKMANFEMQIFISPISFGGYNSEMKKALDRYSALGLVTYTVHKGELHHQPRYPNPVLFMSIGVLDKVSEKQEETFKLVSQRMAIASFAEQYTTVLLNTLENNKVLDKLKEGFKELGVIS